MSKATKTVAKLMPVPQPDPIRNAFKILGTPARRVDGKLKVTGGAVYTADYPVKNITYAVPVHSTIAKGKITQITTSAAEDIPGVLAVMTYQNAPRMKTPANAGLSSLLEPLAGSATTIPIMQDENIHWNGEIIAVVIATTLEVAKSAAALVQIRYSEETAILSVTANKESAFIPDHIVLQPSELKKGNASKALESAKVILDEIYITPYHHHQAMEPHATIAMWEDENRLTIYDTTQYLAGVRDALSEIFKLKKENVRVISDLIGGGFGGKVCMWSNVPLTAAASRLVGRPVKLVLPRSSVNFAIGGRSMTEQRVAFGATAEGRLISHIHTGYSMCTENVFAEQFSISSRHMYESDTIFTQQHVVRLDRLQNTFMRAPGESPGSFALESAVDELARKLKTDPIELRLLNEPTKDPTESSPFSSRFLRECYALGAEKFDWPKEQGAPGMKKEGDWYVGAGMAAAWYPVSLLPVTVRTKITKDGTVTVYTSSIEMGVGATTIQTQHIADRFGVSMDKAIYIQGDTNLPVARSVGGSAGSFSVGSAIQATARLLKGQLYKLSQKDRESILYGLKQEELELGSGGLYKKDRDDTGESFETILTKNDKDFLECEADSASAIPTQQFSIASYGAHFCEVKVHELTRQVKVTRFVSAVDCGKVLNAATARSQIMGGIIMGIGMALFEESIYDDRTGRLMNPNLGEYHIPVNKDIPEIEIHFIDKPDPVYSMGAKGAGELGITGVAAAIANAIYQATGKRVRSLPITSDKLL